MLRYLIRLLMSALLPSDAFSFSSAERDGDLARATVGPHFDMTHSINGHAGLCVISVEAAPAQ